MIPFLLGLAAFVPHIAIGGGATALVSGLVSKFAPVSWSKVKFYAWLVAVVAAIAAVVALTVWFMTLKSDAEAYRVEHKKVLALENHYDCIFRDNVAEHDLWACLPARDRDVADAHAKALQEQQDTAAHEQNVLQGQVAKLQQDLQQTDSEIDAESAADDGPLPKTLTNAWARERAKRGQK